ncbi:MAG: transposase [Candidatus Omnitrophota bacterium]
MPRKPRLLVEDACYHVISRGLEKKRVYREDPDYEKFIKLLKSCKEKFDLKIYTWCLMPTHPHLVTSCNMLSEAMHFLNFSYAQYFNYKYKRVGYLWQGRFKSYIVEKDKYLLNLLSYVEYNPVRAKIVDTPEEYRWSSYRARVLGYDEFGLLDPVNFFCN